MSELSDPRTGTGVGRAGGVALWGLQLLTAAAIIGAGVSTVGGAEQPAHIFHQIGWGDWFRDLVGVLEIAGGVALVVPRLCGLAALGLTGIWVGAVATHLFWIGGSPGAAAVLLVLSAVIAWARRGRIRP